MTMLNIYHCYECSFPLASRDGKLHLLNDSGEMEEFSLNFGTVLEFATGAPSPPPAGFGMMKPTIAFHDMNQFPRSNTCANTLYLPVGRPLLSEDQFVYYMSYGILNVAGFGHV